MRNADGSFKERFVDSPVGGVVKLFISLDEAPKQAAIRRHGKGMATLLGRAIGKTVEFQERSGELVVEWQVVAKVDFPQKDTPQIWFGTDGMEKTCITKQQIREASASAASNSGFSASNTRWEQDV